VARKGSQFGTQESIIRDCPLDFGWRQFLKFSVQRLAKHLDRYHRLHPENGQQVRINPTAQRHIPEVTAVRTASFSSFVSVICANYTARLHPICILEINHSLLCSNIQWNKCSSSVMAVNL